MSDVVPAATASAFSRLSSREQTMVIIMGVALTLALVLGLSFVVSKRLRKAELRVNERQDQMQMIEALEGQYRAAEAQQNDLKQRLQRNPVQLFSLLNKTATDLGLGLDNLNERTTPLKDTGVSEVSVDVSLKDLSITKLHKFLEKLEGQNAGVVKVTKLRVKTSYQNEDNLDVNMTVSTYRLTPGGATP